MDNVKEVIEGCINNDEKSQKILFDYFYRRMFIICKCYMNDDDEAKDVLQDGFIKVFNSIHKFNASNEAQLHNWVKQIMSNTAIDHLRKKKKYKFISIEDTSHKIIIDNTPEEKEYIDNIEKKENKLLSFIPELPPCYRKVITKYVLEGKKHKEIAEELGINESTSKTHYMRAKIKLKQMLGEDIY